MRLPLGRQQRVCEEEVQGRVGGGGGEDVPLAVVEDGRRVHIASTGLAVWSGGTSRVERTPTLHVYTRMLLTAAALGYHHVARTVSSSHSVTGYDR